MKTRTAVLAVLVLSLGIVPCVSAQQDVTDGPPIGQLLDQWRQARAHRSPVQPNVVAVDWADKAFIIPAAGNAGGSRGTYFRSDMTIINYRSAQQRVAVGWMPQGSNNCASSTKIITLNTGWRFYEDFVGQLGFNGIGALVFIAVDASGNPDTNGNIDGFSRIWTRQPNGPGTSSQQFPAIDAKDLASTIRAYVIGLRQDAGFRTNVGIVNLDTASHTWDVETYPSNNGPGPIPSSITVQPCSLQQAPVPAGNHGPLLVSFIQRSPAAPDWTGYGSSTDNESGDGWIVHATHAF